MLIHAHRVEVDRRQNNGLPPAACRLPLAACRLPPAVHVPRPRNKRASVQRAAQAVSAGSTGHALAIA